MLKKIIIIFLLLSFAVYAVFYFFDTKKNTKTHLPQNSIDSVVVYKSKHQLLAYSGGKLIKIYPISIGKNPIGDKEFEGDKKHLKATIQSIPKMRIADGIKT